MSLDISIFDLLAAQQVSEPSFRYLKGSCEPQSNDFRPQPGSQSLEKLGSLIYETED